MTADDRILERLVRLEVKVERMEDGFTQLNNGQQEILLELQKYRGFLGAVTLLGGGAVSTLVFTKDWILGHFK